MANGNTLQQSSGGLTKMQSRQRTIILSRRVCHALTFDQTVTVGKKWTADQKWERGRDLVRGSRTVDS